MQSILLSYMVFFGGGDAVRTCVEMLGRRGGANFLLKCHGLCPICLTFFVVHFYTHIYVSILYLWMVPVPTYLLEGFQIIFVIFKGCVNFRPRLSKDNAKGIIQWKL